MTPAPRPSALATKIPKVVLIIPPDSPCIRSSLVLTACKAAVVAAAVAAAAAVEAAAAWRWRWWPRRWWRRRRGIFRARVAGGGLLRLSQLVDGVVVVRAEKWHCLKSIQRLAAAYAGSLLRRALAGAAGLSALALRRLYVAIRVLLGGGRNARVAANSACGQCLTRRNEYGLTIGRK
jgi:hypothetical protein